MENIWARGVTGYSDNYYTAKMLQCCRLEMMKNLNNTPKCSKSVNNKFDNKIDKNAIPFLVNGAVGVLNFAQKLTS